MFSLEHPVQLVYSVFTLADVLQWALILPGQVGIVFGHYFALDRLESLLTENCYQLYFQLKKLRDSLKTGICLPSLFSDVTVVL